jgi:hypothetical protein
VKSVVRPFGKRFLRNLAEKRHKKNQGIKDKENLLANKEVSLKSSKKQQKY